MRHLPTLLAHELRMLLFNPGTYVAAVLFLLLMGFIFAGILESYAAAPQETPPAAVFFELFWIPVFFMVPLLTMKSISEERRLGTLETLLTSPVSTTEVVLGKYGAAYALYLGLWGSTAGFFWILQRFTAEAGLLDPGPLIGGYVFIAVSGLLFVAIGLFASSLTRSQAVAGILGFVLLFALIVGARFVGTLPVMKMELFAPARAALEYGQVFTHLEDFTRGIIDTRQLIFYLSGTTLTLLLSILGLEAKQLHA